MATGETDFNAVKIKSEVLVVDCSDTPKSAVSIVSDGADQIKTGWGIKTECRFVGRLHPDVSRACSLLLNQQDFVECTGLKDWKKSAGPVVGTLVDDSKQFETFGGTAICFCDWLSDSGNLYVTDLRLTFPTDDACTKYHELALASNAEIIFHHNGDTVTQMMEVETKSSSLSHVGSCCHVFCGPTNEARTLRSSLLLSEGAQCAETVEERVRKAMHVVYLFREDRVVCKLCVTSFNCLVPYGHAFVLAQCCDHRMRSWQSGLNGTSGRLKIEDKSTLREIFRRRALQRQMMMMQGPQVKAVSDADSTRGERNTSGENIGACKDQLFKLNLFVAALGKGNVVRDEGKGSERLAAICSKVPKDQVITVESPAVGRGSSERVDLKLRLFVARSEDAKAVQTYIGAHAKQRPAPFVVLFESLPVAVPYTPDLLSSRRELSPAAADRLRKQAKARAVRFVRRVLAEASRRVTSRDLKGGRGAGAVASVLSGLLPKHLSSLSPGGPKVLMLTDEESFVRTEPAARGRGVTAARVPWVLDEVEGVDGLMALCQSPPASGRAGFADDDWAREVLASGRRGVEAEELREDMGSEGATAPGAGSCGCAERLVEAASSESGGGGRESPGR